jgi:hypothetical protein
MRAWSTRGQASEAIRSKGPVFWYNPAHRNTFGVVKANAVSTLPGIRRKLAQPETPP